MNDKKIDLVDKKRVFTGYSTVDEYRFKHSLFQGGMSPELSRELCHKGHFSLVLLYDPELDVVLLTEQVRIGVFAAQEQGIYPAERDAWLIEAVAGGIDEGETPEQAAIREAREESGCEIIKLHPLGTTFTSPGSMSEMAFLYVGIIEMPEEGVFGHPDEGENIRTFIISADEAIEMAHDGRILNSTTMIALMRFERLRWGY